ncbi:hypothetical protein IMG5_021840 [Ichthyophthirius multifiliis]|uniref:Transmembrane protein n=1 Tax=Ichthyophthirius multifiliis TaxID=5932 RepID=G0QKU0_ICHMU|nr:hypothetical protein IMG5_021840 [Ichthyophthirius multifiliis]EGR34164.1 hypothetical protein IMG5_021840 [Ichthyophthirius multifiliis]|eukprot:XP_004039468.1 hypothetical protein IMG5_021840 [Ichthyophthirius multifiliis]
MMKFIRKLFQKKILKCFIFMQIQMMIILFQQILMKEILLVVQNQEIKKSYLRIKVFYNQINQTLNKLVQIFLKNVLHFYKFKEFLKQMKFQYLFKIVNKKFN